MKPTDDAPPSDAPELHDVGVAHEHSDINVRAVIIFAAGLVTVAIIVQVAMWLLFGVFERQAVANDPVVSPLAAPETVMPKNTAGSPYFGGAAGPQLVTDEPRLLRTLRVREYQDLHTYGWVDQANGVARLPIDQAEKLLLQRGLPSRTTGQADPRLGTYGQSLGESSSGRDIPILEQPAGAEGQPAGSEPQPGSQGQSVGTTPGAQPKKPGGGQP